MTLKLNIFSFLLSSLIHDSYGIQCNECNLINKVSYKECPGTRTNFPDADACRILALSDGTIVQQAMTPAVLCHETNFKTLRRTVARLYKDGAAVVLCCFEDGCNASVERVKDSLRRVNSAPSDPDNQIQIINIGGSSNTGGGSKVGTSDVLAQLQQVNNTDTNATKSFINEEAKREIKEDTKSLIEDDSKSLNEIADSTQLQDTKSSFDVRESKHVLDPTNEAGYDDLFLDKKELPQSVVARRSNFEVK